MLLEGLDEIIIYGKVFGTNQVLECSEKEKEK